MPDEDALLTIAEVADRMRCSRRTVYRIIGRGELRTLRVGSRLRVVEIELRDYLTRGTAATAAEGGSS